VPELRAAASPECLERVHGLLDRLYAEAGDVDGVAQARFSTAVAELVANVVEHGRRADGGPPSFTLHLSAEPGRLTAELRDDGDAAVIDLDAPMPGEADEHGRGIPMIREAVDELRHSREGAGNHWTIVLERRPAT
jgi:serine/threonine-protein kinase RsbW